MCLSQARIWISNVIGHGLFCFPWRHMSGNCLFSLQSLFMVSFNNTISYLRVDPWVLRLYHPEALLYSLRRSRRLYSGAEGWYNLNAHG
jgi:hypothetical protein